MGQTDNLASRERIHNGGEGGSHTAARRPVAMIYAEQHATRLAAVRRERQNKGWSRIKKAALAAGDTATLKRLSKCRHP